MRRTIFLFFILTLLISCGETKTHKEDQLSLIHELESELFLEDGSLDQTKATPLIRAYDQFFINFNEDERAPEFLHRAVDLSVGIMRYEEAVNFIDRLLKDVPDYNKNPQALFLKAFILENHLQKLGHAKDIYNEFLDKYPTHELAKDARFSLDNLGKSPEELIELFEAQQQES